MHRVLLHARRRRLPKLFLLVTALALPLTACGQDLGKSNFARTTVPAGASTGQTTDGPITDAAVAANVLRTIKPCQFLTKDALGSLGLASGNTRGQAGIPRVSSSQGRG